MQIRLIIYSNQDGSREGVNFTEDFTTDADDFVPPGCTIDFDEVISADLPSAFPTERNLEK